MLTLRARPAPQHRLQVLFVEEDLPTLAIDAFPLGVRHFRMMIDPMMEIVLAHIRVHPNALGGEHLVVLGAGQRRQEKEFQQVERQLTLDDFDVAADFFRGVLREAEDVARVGRGADVFPRLQHLAIFPDLVLPLLCRHQRVGIDVLEPDEYPVAAGAGATSQ